MRTIALAVGLCLFAVPGWAQETFSVGVLHGTDGVVIPLFEFRSGEWGQIQPENPWTGSTGLASSWTPPSKWFFWQSSGFHQLDVEEPVPNDSRIWVQPAPETALPSPRWFLVVSDSISRPYPFHDSRDRPLEPTIITQEMRIRLDEAEGAWTAENGPIGPRVDNPGGSPVAVAPPIIFTRFEKSPRGGWIYVEASRAYGPRPGSQPPGAWNESHLVGWLKLAYPGRTIAATALEFGLVEAFRPGSSTLILLGEVEHEERVFVIALRAGWEGYVPVLIELTEDAPVLIAEYSVSIEGS